MINLRGQTRNFGERNFKSLYHLSVRKLTKAIKLRVEINEIENICHRMYRMIKINVLKHY